MKLLPSLRSYSNIRDVCVKARVLQREIELDRLRTLKRCKGITYAQLARELGCNKVWIASVFCGQNPCDPKTAKKLSELLDDNEEVSHISQIPVRGNTELISDPVVYRLQELVSVYGSSIRELIHEEFGDGILSAIDCKLEIQRKETDKGPRVVLTIDGKFLPYYDGSEEKSQ